MSFYRKSEIPEHLQTHFQPAELGLEKTPEEYVEKMVLIFREVRRVLKKDGTLWLNLGDSYAGGGKGNYGSGISTHGGKIAKHANGKDFPVPDGLKPKDLVGIPWRVAFALQADGWYLRSDIIWHKPNPMPESVTDRPTKSHEYIFLMSKSAKYFYDANAVKEPAVTQEDDKAGHTFGGNKRTDMMMTHSNIPGKKWDWAPTRNKRSVWTVTTKPYKEAHFATFPPDLIVPCIKAGSRKGDIVLDPFGGSMTTAYVAKELNRQSIMIELNEKYIHMGTKRLAQEVLPL